VDIPTLSSLAILLNLVVVVSDIRELWLFFNGQK
jgi:hypothetical protein